MTFDHIIRFFPQGLKTTKNKKKTPKNPKRRREEESKREIINLMYFGTYSQTMHNSGKLCLLCKYQKQSIVSQNTVAFLQRTERIQNSKEAKTGNNEHRI